MLKTVNVKIPRISYVRVACGSLVCFTSCPCGKQVDGSPHVVHTDVIVVGRPPGPAKICDICDFKSSENINREFISISINILEQVIY